MTETEVKAEADMLHAERMTRREIARCLKRKGYPVRQALSVGMTYIQAERLVNGSRPLRGTDAAIAASDALKASMICDEIWKLCDYPTIRKRSAEVTDSPLDDLTKAEPSAA